LLSLGHLSRLGEKIAPEFGEHHSFDKPQPNTVIAYHRDRGDAVEPYFVYKNLDDFAARCHYDMAITSLHVWVDGTWLYRHDWRDKKWMRFEIIILDPPEDEYEKNELK